MSFDTFIRSPVDEMVLENPPEYSHDSAVTIAVMGVTGSGKSTFINLVSGSALEVSGGLASCTQEVQKATRFTLDGRTVHLLDTPGFDDTDRKDADILKTIAGFLEKEFKDKRRLLHGVIYLHRISDTRVGGAARRSFKLLQNLCGDESLKNIVITTTMWEKTCEARAVAREEELRTDDRLFEHAMDKDAKMSRHDNTLESAQDIIRDIFANHPIPLCIQVELVQDRKHIAQTKAGKEVENGLEELEQKLTEEVEKLRDNLRDIKQSQSEVAALQKELDRSRHELDRAKEQLEKLKAGLVPVNPGGGEEEGSHEEAIGEISRLTMGNDEDAPVEPGGGEEKGSHEKETKKNSGGNGRPTTGNNEDARTPVKLVKPKSYWRECCCGCFGW